MRNYRDRFWRRTVLTGVVAALAVGGVAAPSGHKHKAKAHVASHAQAIAALTRKAQLSRKLHGLHSQMHQVRAKIQTTRAKEGRIKDTIQTVEGRLTHTRRKLQHVNTRLTALANEHMRTVNRLNATQERLALRRRLLAQRLSDNYRRSPATDAAVLLEARSVHELLSRGYYVRQVVHSDAELIQGVRQDLQQIQDDKRQLEAQAEEQKQLATEFEAQKQQYAADLQTKQELLQNVQATREEAEDELDGLEDEANAMTDRIRQLSELLRERREAQLREAQARQEAQRKEAERLARLARLARRRHLPPPPEPVHQEPAEESPAIPPVWHGEFIKPCVGPVTSPFGWRFHPILHRRKMHTGIDFGAPYGSSIHAAGAGTVIMAEYTRGYGNCVIIDHGDGVTTLYGHCSALLVSVGDNVSQGQIIARVGATGMATGPHLHFEVRHNGVPVPPFGK